jgi:hypothetical protein
MASHTSLAANNSTLACDTVEVKAKPLCLGFINIALVNDSERTLNLVEPPIYPQKFNIFCDPLPTIFPSLMRKGILNTPASSSIKYILILVVCMV